MPTRLRDATRFKPQAAKPRRENCLASDPVEHQLPQHLGPSRCRASGHSIEPSVLVAVAPSWL